MDLNRANTAWGRGSLWSIIITNGHLTEGVTKEGKKKNSKGLDDSRQESREEGVWTFCKFCLTLATPVVAGQESSLGIYLDQQRLQPP